MRKTFGTKWDDVTEGWKKLRIKELHDLYSSVCNSVIKSCRTRCIEKRNIHQVLTGKPEGKILFERQM
jgi:hypothetical protein